MKKVLITGAAGFIGSHLVEYLLTKGVPSNKLRLLVPDWEDLDNLPRRKYEIVRGDIRDKKLVSKTTHSVGLIYHLAAKTVSDKSTFKDYVDTNVSGTVNLLRAGVSSRVTKFIFFSSISVFGLPAWKGDMIDISEDSPKEPSEPYGLSKLEAEKKVLLFNKKHGLPYVIIRPTTVYGPGDKAGITQLFRSIKNHYFFFIGDGDNLMDYVYVKDLVSGVYLAAINKRMSGDYILGSGKPITFNKIVGTVARNVGERPPNFRVPKSVGLFASYLVKHPFKLIGKTPPLFPERVKVMTTNCYFNISRAEREIKYNPKYSIEKGIKLTADWLKKESII